MPEGHTIHRIARDHQKWFLNQTVGVFSPQGRFATEAKKLDGQKINDVTAHGKHLFYHWNKGKIVHIHLGLYGKFRVFMNPAPEPRGAVRLRMIGEERSFDLNGPNCCELISVKELQTIRQRLGQDPLRNDACPDALWERFSRSRSAIGTLLLNQSVIAGVGNVYRAEILFLLRINPEKPAKELDRVQFDELWRLTVQLLKVGVKYNRIITVNRDDVSKPLSRLNSSERLHVYKKQKCGACGTKIRVWLLGNRKMYACPKCQRK